MKFDLVFSNAVDNFKSKFERVVELYVLTLPRRSGTHMNRYRCCMQGTSWGMVGTLTLTSLVLLLTLSSGTRKYRYQCVYGYPLTPGRILEKKKYVYGYSSGFEIGFLGKTHFHIHILTWTMNWIWIVNNWYVDKKARKYRSKINNLVNIILYYWIDGIFRNAFSFKLYFRN